MIHLTHRRFCNISLFFLVLMMKGVFMPVFDFNNTPEPDAVPECTYTTFASDENVSSADKPLLVLDNSKKAWKHHSCGTFTNQNKRTAFEFKEDDGSTVIADIKKWMPAL